MLYVTSIILGTITILLSVLYAYEWSGGDPYVYIFAVTYACGICTFMYGLSNICKLVNKE